MLGRRTSMMAGKTLNQMAERIRNLHSVVNVGDAAEFENAVRIANEIIYQYYLIPKDVREFWHQEVGAYGIRVQNLAEK